MRVCDLPYAALPLSEGGRPRGARHHGPLGRYGQSNAGNRLAGGSDHVCGLPGFQGGLVRHSITVIRAWLQSSATKVRGSIRRVAPRWASATVLKATQPFPWSKFHSSSLVLLLT